jgi:hypothetical protein
MGAERRGQLPLSSWGALEGSIKWEWLGNPRKREVEVHPGRAMAESWRHKVYAESGTQ